MTVLNEQQEKQTLYREENNKSQNHGTRLYTFIINFKYKFGYNRTFKKCLFFLKCVYTVRICTRVATQNLFPTIDLPQKVYKHNIKG